MLKTSICASGIEDVELFKKRLSIVKNAGFDAIDLDLYSKEARGVLHRRDAEKYAYVLKQAVADAGLFFAQGHPAFHPRNIIHPEEGERVIEDIRQAIHFSAALGLPYLVCHPVRPSKVNDPLFYKWDELHKLNVEMYGALVDEAGEVGVTICTENIFNHDRHMRTIAGYTSHAKEMVKIMDDVPGLCICMDTGHAAVTGQDYGKFVRACGDRLKALHLHGNDGITDLHLCMFDGMVTDWDGLTDALTEIGYSGTMNAEIERFNNVPEELLPACYEYLYKCTRYLADKVGIGEA